MASALSLTDKYSYIELNRTFREIPTSENRSDDTDFSAHFLLSGHLTWEEILKEFRVVILSEAGAGKTEEVRHTAKRLRQEGKDAFFLRLEHVGSAFEVAFEEGTFEDFEAWLASNREGWLLLDSVDEARLKGPADFDLAIRIFGRHIRLAKDRAHIFITCRASAWRPKTDLDNCEAQLPFALVKQEDRNEGSDAEDKRKTTTKERPSSIFKVLALSDLNSSQVEVFAKMRGVGSVEAFLNAIEREDAWKFSAHPQDLQQLVDFWIDNQRIGNRFELIRNSIERRLKEHDQDRAEKSPLSIEKARAGAKLLAAAATLTQQQILRVPDGLKNQNGLDTEAVLEGWNSKEVAALLSRPLFDEAIYSTIRFYHRSVREYLTAEWFSDLLGQQTSRRSIEALFFREQFGVQVISPTLRPVLSWLLLLDSKIAQRICDMDPGLVFEGGEPKELPIEMRRNLLRGVCRELVQQKNIQKLYEYGVAHRFAAADITEDVNALIDEYKDNQDVALFLLRMVWIGELKGCRENSLKLALEDKAGKYARIAAIRAIRVVGSPEDCHLLREQLAKEAQPLDRDRLAEFVDGLSPTKEALAWLIACLRKTEPGKRYASDLLPAYIATVFERAESGMLPPIARDLAEMLEIPPVVTHGYNPVSRKHLWLLAPAANLVKRLIRERAPSALDRPTLIILSKLGSMRKFGYEDHIDVDSAFDDLVQNWPELNRRLFWHEAESLRRELTSTSDEELTEYWRVMGYGTFANFGTEDFSYFADEISAQEQLDNKKIALSLAFKLYVDAERPPKWRELLKKKASQSPLKELLEQSLKPAANLQMRRLKEQEYGWKRRDRLRQEKEAKCHEEWRVGLNSDLPLLVDTQKREPGALTNSLIYLYKQTRDDSQRSGRWTTYNWKELAPRFGIGVAQYFRDAAVALWRNRRPVLRSEGAPSTTTETSTIIGLVGLEIESIEVPEWPLNLTELEVELACHYASHELNGFPIWFPRLFAHFPSKVSDFLMQEIEYELSVEKADHRTNYILSDICWTGDWSWDAMGPRILSLLRQQEPSDIENLGYLLTILQGSSVADLELSLLSRDKCKAETDSAALAYWYAVWMGVDASSALDALVEYLSHRADCASDFTMTFLVQLLGGRGRNPVRTRNAFKTPQHLKTLYLLAHEQVRAAEDLDRAGTGVYSPGIRDNAQDAREALLEALKAISGKEAFLVLQEIGVTHPETSYRPRILEHAKKKAEIEGDIPVWSIEQVREFAIVMERTPTTHRELAELVHLKFLDLRDEFQDGDDGIAPLLAAIKLETDMRKYIGHVLREGAGNKYHVVQEEELGDGKKPDLRFNAMNIDYPVPAELKLAENWTGPELFERLENQLCGDYLRDKRSGYGFFVLVRRGGQEHWEEPHTRKRLTFAELTAELQKHWSAISSRFPNIDWVHVIGIDLTRRCS